MRVARGRHDHESDIRPHAFDHDVGIDGSVGKHRHEIELETEVVRGLLERRMRADGSEKPGLSVARPVVAGRLDREQATLCTARGDAADDVIVSVQHVARERDDLALHDGDRGERGGVEPVDRLHHPDGVGGQLVELGNSGVVDVRQHATAVGGSIGFPQFRQPCEHI